MRHWRDETAGTLMETVTRASGQRARGELHEAVLPDGHDGSAHAQRAARVHLSNDAPTDLDRLEPAAEGFPEGAFEKPLEPPLEPLEPLPLPDPELPLELPEPLPLPDPETTGVVVSLVTLPFLSVVVTCVWPFPFASVVVVMSVVDPSAFTTLFDVLFVPLS